MIIKNLLRLDGQEEAQAALAAARRELAKAEEQSYQDDLDRARQVRNLDTFAQPAAYPDGPRKRRSAHDGLPARARAANAPKICWRW